MRIIPKLLSVLCLLMAASAMLAIASTADASLTDTVQAMKENPRGPFKRLRWFCADGSVLPPEPYACSERGGGVQHGEYSAETLKIRAAGYPIATLLADVQPEDIVGSPDGTQLLKHMLLEQFLIGFDNGWIFRQAQFYRGAVQHEDEQANGQALLEALAADPAWVRDRFLVLREAVRLLPHDNELLSLTDLRGRAAAIADRDPGFRALRGKIHGRPDAQDARRVREYARSNGKPELAAEYETLAQVIDQTYAGGDLGELLVRTARSATTRPLQDLLSELVEAPRSTAAHRLAVAAQAMQRIRANLSREPDAAARVRLLDSSIELERVAFVAGRELDDDAGAYIDRRTLIGWLADNANALYGSGLITRPEHREIDLSLNHIDDEPLKLARYRRELRQLGMASSWANRQLLFHFGAAIEHFSELEPLVEQFIPDRLRGSQLLAYDSIHGTLALDAQSASAVRHEVFGTPVASGLRSLNPGLARGVLRVADADTPVSEYDAHSIYIVPETLPRLPPVAGILTRSEGNALSHVQLLARNLGIPNIVVSDELLERLKPSVGKRVVIASSGGGVVRIAHDSFEWDNVFRAGRDEERAPLRVDTGKLELDSRRLYTLADLRARHSGRVVGPKAAKLGELMHQFPGQVAPGLVLPFGIYRSLLDQPVSPDRDVPMIVWLKGRYDYLDALREEDISAFEAALDETLDFVRGWFQTVALPPGLESQLRQAMKRTFGREESYGVFVRSDTNVEDLPNFSGAGLNLTVPNVVGFENTLAAIRRVWASPFTDRAYAWRQSLMDKPEHVYASVLLQLGVPAEKSGVLVTQDLDSGARDVATVVVNEGVGGGVDGQLAETLTIELGTGVVRRLSSATATQRTVLAAGGGVESRPVSSAESILNEDEIEALRRLTRIIPTRVREFSTGDGREPPAADVEFGFYDGKLWLFQVRPFVESGSANRNRYLNALDAGLRDTADRVIDLDGAPEVARS